MRTIDARARRRLLADAVWRLMRQGGLEAASVRGVAAEAGLATGSVRHFFGTQDELHVFAMRELIRMVTERVEEVFAREPESFDLGPKDQMNQMDQADQMGQADQAGQAGQTGHGEVREAAARGVWTATRARARVVAVLMETLPVSTQQSELFAAHLQFVTKAIVHPVLRPVALETADLMHRLNTGLIEFLVQTGAARAGLDVPQAAADLGVLLDGIVFRRLTAPHLFPEADVPTVVTKFVTSLGPGRPRGETS